MKRIRIVIADDHSIIRSGLKMLFRGEPRFAVVGEAGNGREALDLIGRLRPDVAILDISMPVLGGIEATRLIREEYPQTKVLILTIYENEEYVHQMVRAGASGYVLKDAGKKDLFAAVRAIAGGERFFSPGVSKMIIEEFIKQSQGGLRMKQQTSDRLTGRETEILRYIAGGMTNSEIAEKLFLSPRTIDTHRNNLMQKLDIHDVAGLVRYAIEAGLVTIKPKG